MDLADEINDNSVSKIFFISFISLLLGHFLLQSYMPNLIVGVFSYFILLLILGFVLVYSRDIFGFIMVIYVCNHFCYGDNHGGLWNIVAFSILIIYFLLGRYKKEVMQKQISINILLFIFVFFNLIGWIIKNPMPVVALIKGAAAFLGYILVFYITKNLRISKREIKVLVSLSFILLIYQFAVALMQYYSVLKFNSPLIGGNTVDIGIVTEYNRPVGTVGHFELFAEYALLIICLLIPILSSSTTIENKLDYFKILIMLLICFMIIVITSMRAAFVLSFFIIFCYYLIFNFRIFKFVDMVRNQISVAILGGVIFTFIGAYVGIAELERDFLSIDTNNISVENLVSGKSINRGGLFDLALSRLETESWVIGHGSGTIDSNRWAWFGIDPTKKNIPVADFHSLYLSLPMIYGWVGSFAFLAIIVFTMSQLLHVTIKYRKKKNCLLVLSLGLTVMWCAFLVHQYKISILRNANYQMLFWIWLGLSISVVNTIKDTWKNEKNISSHSRN